MRRRRGTGRTTSEKKSSVKKLLGRPKKFPENGRSVLSNGVVCVGICRPSKSRLATARDVEKRVLADDRIIALEHVLVERVEPAAGMKRVIVGDRMALAVSVPRGIARCRQRSSIGTKWSDSWNSVGITPVGPCIRSVGPSGIRKAGRSKVAADDRPGRGTASIGRPASSAVRKFHPPRARAGLRTDNRRSPASPASP